MLKADRSESCRIVEQALSFEPPDRLPVSIFLYWDEFLDKWRRERNLPPEANIEDYYHQDLAIDVADEQFFPSQMGEKKRDGDFIFVDDGWGRIVRQREGTWFSETVERILNEPSELDRIEFEPAGLDLRYHDFVSRIARQQAKGKATFIKIGGPFIRCSFFRGETEFLLDLVRDEAFARALVEKVGDHLLQIGLESLRRTSAGEFGVWIFDDMCSLGGPMFSPQTFTRIFQPVYARMVAQLKAAGARWVMLHCDGNLLPLLDQLIEVGIEGINPVEPSAGLDAVKLLKQYHGRLRLIGGVCNTHVLPSGDKERIRRHVEAIVEAGKYGGLIIGTHSIGPDVPVDSFEFFREIISNFD